MNRFSIYEDEVLVKLQPLGDHARSEQAQNDKKSQLQFLAIRVPQLRKITQTGFSFSDESEETILAIWNYIWHTSPYFEVMSVASMYYELQKSQIPFFTWSTLVHWQQRVENWAHCDGLASIYSYQLAQCPLLVYPQLQIWNRSANQWQRRLSLVSLIHYTGKNAVFMTPDDVFPLIYACLDDQRPYVQKAVGWVLREMSKKYSNAVKQFVMTNSACMASGTRTIVRRYLATNSDEN
jgi:3-methyladenine DNA glycosylase AlkD